jgi:BON domain
MAANEFPINAPPSGAPQEPAKTPAQDSSSAPGWFAGLSDWGHLRLLAVAALGAACGFLAGTGLEGALHPDPKDGSAGWQLFLLKVIVAGVGAYFFFDPGMEALHRWLRGETEPPAPRVDLAKGRKIFAIGITVVATLVMSALHESLGASVGRELRDFANALKNNLDKSVADELSSLADKLGSVHGGVGFVLVVLIGVASIAFAVTHFWIVGAKRTPPRATRWGVFVSLIVGLVVLLLVGLLLSYYLPHLPPRWRLSLVAALAIFWLLSGFLGGLAIDNRLGGPLSRRLGPHHATRALWALVGFSLIFVGLLLSLALVTHRMNVLVLLVAAQLVLQNFGWGFGMYLHREHYDLHPAPPDAPPGAPRPGPVPVPRPSPPSSDLAARAQDLLLKPKGDRLLAAAVLVLALAIAVVAHPFGYFRTDTEIVNNIQIIFLQDSGLRRAGLTVHSSGRVVMISGVVEDETEHAAAVQRALSVRGVKQLIDQIQVTPSQPHPPITPTPAEVVPSQKIAPPAPSINATISLGGAAGPGKAARPKPPVTAGSQKLAEPPKAAESQKQTEATKPADSQKHRGLLGLLKKGKNNVTGSTTDAHKADTQKPDENSKSSDTQKHGLFHFLKKDKNKENNKVQPNKNDTKNKKNTTKDPTAH